MTVCLGRGTFIGGPGVRRAAREPRAAQWHADLNRIRPFSSIQKAKKAQQDYRAGRRVTAGNGRVLQLVKAA